MKHLIFSLLFSSCAFIVRPEGEVTTPANTVPSTLLITHTTPSFCHSIEGYCEVKDGVCTGKHYRTWRGKVYLITPPDKVWKCERRGHD
jgi:hypothetical protein